MSSLLRQCLRRAVALGSTRRERVRKSPGSVKVGCGHCVGAKPRASASFSWLTVFAPHDVFVSSLSSRRPGTIDGGFVTQARIIQRNSSRSPRAPMQPAANSRIWLHRRPSAGCCWIRGCFPAECPELPKLLAVRFSFRLLPLLRDFDSSPFSSEFGLGLILVGNRRGHYVRSDASYSRRHLLE